MTKNQTLYLLRHAEAEPWSPGVRDLDRPLTESGTRHMERLSNWASSRLVPPQLVFCSPSARTRETLTPLLRGWIGSDAALRYEPIMYEATTGRLQSLVEAGFSAVDALLLVGHNPGLEYLSQRVLPNQDDQNMEGMGTGSLAVIEFVGGWLQSDGVGALVHWLNRSQFE